MFVSIIVPAHNAERTLGQCLEASLAQTYPDIEVIVVDDGSTDDTSRVAQVFEVHYVRQEKRGPAAARNRGAQEAKGDILAFTDADCIPEPQWIERLVGRFEEGVAAVGGAYAIANPDSLLARTVHEEIALRHARFGDEVNFLGSFNVAYRKSAFDAVGGFDEEFTMASGEDNDLAYRLTDLGWRLGFVKDARVAHFHPTRLRPYLSTQMWHGFWRVKLYAKHPRRAARGDRYAGIIDLLAPAWALALLGTLPVAFVGGLFYRGLVGAGFLWGWMTLAMPYLLVHTPAAIRMARRTHDKRMLMFGDLALLRDVARAIGMTRGIWTFLIRRRKRHRRDGQSETDN